MRYCFREKLGILAGLRLGIRLADLNVGFVAI
jgi:hypothetical protein